MSTVKRKLLLIACSNRKLRTKGLLPAIERYDGVTYRVIRKAQREGYFPKSVDIKILSAKFGLIDADTPIPHYDRRMDKERAKELLPQVKRQLTRFFRRAKYSEIFINLGKDYLLATGNIADIAGQKTIVKYALGGIGTKAQTMKTWLVDSY